MSHIFLNDIVLFLVALKFNTFALLTPQCANRLVKVGSISYSFFFYDILYDIVILQIIYQYIILFLKAQYHRNSRNSVKLIQGNNNNCLQYLFFKSYHIYLSYYCRSNILYFLVLRKIVR